MNQEQVLKNLEQIIGKSIKRVEDIQADNLGVQYRNNKIIGISMNHCELKEVPDSIQYLKDIEYLDLANNKIKELPDWFDEMENIKILKFSNNDINEIPRSIGKMQNLEVFHILNNPIDRLPMSFRKYTDIYSQFREIAIKRYGLDGNTIETIQMLRDRGVRIIEPKN